MPRVKSIAIDFDWTLSRFNDRNGLYSIFLRRGVTQETVQQALTKAVAAGFTINLFKEDVERVHGKLERSEAITIEFQGWLESALEPYPDSSPFLMRWFGRVPIAIVAHGDHAYQQQKVHASRLAYNELHVVAPPQHKVDVLKDILNRHGSPLLFIEDKPDELDNAYAHFGPKNVITVLLLREDSRYSHGQCRYNHVRLNSLQEANALIED